MENQAAADACWRFSLALYARPGVADALLAIQDRTATDVNLMLFGLWFGAARGCCLTAASLAAAEAAIAPIATKSVAPLRQLRRQLKQAADGDLQALRRRIAGLEVAAERLVQYRLAASLAAGGGSFEVHAGEVQAGPECDRLTASKANLALVLGKDASSPEAGTIRRAVAALMRRS